MDSDREYLWLMINFDRDVFKFMPCFISNDNDIMRM